MKTIIKCLVLVFASTGSSFAQSASETASAYFDLLSDGEYRKAAGFYSPDALKDFRARLNFVEAFPNDEAKEFYTFYFGPGASRNSISKLSDAEFFSGFLSSFMKTLEEMGIHFEKIEVLGEVSEGEDVVHVLARNHVSAGGQEREAMEVVSFMKSNGEWKAMLSSKMKDMPTQLQRAYQARQKVRQRQKEPQQ